MLWTSHVLVNYLRNSHYGGVNNFDVKRKSFLKTCLSTTVMHDYSDEEFESSPSIRKRSNSLSKDVSEVSKELGFRPRAKQFFQNEENRSFAVQSQPRSLFKNFKERSSRLTMPQASEAFLITDFINRKVDNGSNTNSRLQTFNLNFKADGPTINKTDVFSRNHEDKLNSFYKSMKTVVILAQIFAVMPISGAFGPNYKGLQFKWFYFGTFYWILAFSGIFFTFVCLIRYSVSHGEITQSFSGIIFFLCNTISSLLCFNLGRNWKTLNEEFADMEMKLNKYGYPRRINLKFKIFTIFFLPMGLLEHLLSKYSAVDSMLPCYRQPYEFFNFAEAYFTWEYMEVFSIYSYSFWKGVLLMFVHFLATVSWNFVDLILCLIAWSIAERFKQVQESLIKIQGQDKPITFWKEVREDYNTLSVLTKIVDTYVQKLMVLSIGNNLFFLCIQLLNSLKKNFSEAKVIYFFSSFGFLLLKMTSVTFAAAKVNDESKEPKAILYSVPHKNYSMEVRRFLTQLTTNEVALTGCGFFPITRSLILTIMGTVITYEIVLVQFNTDTVGGDWKNETACLKMFLKTT